MATSHRKDGASGTEYLPTGGGVTWAAGPPIRSLSEMLFCSFDYDLVGHCELLRNMHGTPGQVALNWLLARDPCVIPIPGASHAGNAKQNIGTLDWTLSAEEFADIDVASSGWR